MLITTSLQAQVERLAGIELDSNSYSEASSLYSVAGHWNDAVNSGNEAWSLLRLTLGVKLGRYTLQTILRDDSFFRFANATAQFVYQTNNRLALNVGDEYRLSIVSDKASSRGLRFGLQQKICQRFSIEGYLSLLQPTRLIQGRIEGQATIVGSNDYDFSFDSDLVYGDDPLFERSTGRLNGQGYSIDLMGHFAPSDDWQIDLQLLDIAGRINIEQAPATVASATSDIKQYDDKGYVTYDPAVSGRDFYQDYRYRFEPQMRLAVRYQWSDKLTLGAEHRRVYGFDYQKIMLEQAVTHGTLRWSMVPRMNAIGLALLSKHFSIGLETDRLNTRQMKYLSLNSRFYWSF